MSEKKNSILIVDDERSNIVTLTHILSEEYIVYASKDGWDAVEAANDLVPDLILLDIIMPGMDGFEVITALKKSEKTRNIPVIFVTGLDSYDDEEIGLTFGAVDYISKPFNTTIVNLRVRNQMNSVNQRRIIEELSVTDQLTELPNKRSFNQRLEIEWHRAGLEKKPLSILMADIDDFRKINDIFGHQFGDVILQNIGSIFTRCKKRELDFVARWGGEEFAVLLPDVDAEEAVKIAEHIRQSVEDAEIIFEDGRSVFVTMSFGVNTYDSQEKQNASAFISEAENALYTAKRNGKNTIECLKNTTDIAK